MVFPGVQFFLKTNYPTLSNDAQIILMCEHIECGLQSIEIIDNDKLMNFGYDYLLEMQEVLYKEVMARVNGVY